jgi:hypothetical protein
MEGINHQPLWISSACRARLRRDGDSSVGYCSSLVLSWSRGLLTAHSTGTVLLRLVWAALTVLVGVYLIAEPSHGTLTLTLVLDRTRPPGALV